MFKFGLSSREVDILSRTLAEVQELRMEITTLREQLVRVKSSSPDGTEVFAGEVKTGLVKEEDTPVSGFGRETEGGLSEIGYPAPEGAQPVLSGEDNVSEVFSLDLSPVRSHRPALSKEDTISHPVYTASTETAVEDHSEKEPSPGTVVTPAMDVGQEEKSGKVVFAGEIQKMPPEGPGERENFVLSGANGTCALAGENEPRKMGSDPENQPIEGENAEAAGEQPPAASGDTETIPPAACEEAEIRLHAAAGDWAVVNIPPRSNPWWRFWGKKTTFGKSV